MARPRKSIEEKRAAKARYARNHSKSEYPEGLIQELIDAPESFGGRCEPRAAFRYRGWLGDGGHWKRARNIP